MGKRSRNVSFGRLSTHNGRQARANWNMVAPVPEVSWSAMPRSQQGQEIQLDGQWGQNGATVVGQNAPIQCGNICLSQQCCHLVRPPRATRSDVPVLPRLPQVWHDALYDFCTKGNTLRSGTRPEFRQHRSSEYVVVSSNHRQHGRCVVRIGPPTRTVCATQSTPARVDNAS